MNTWMDVTMNIYNMEKITAPVNYKLEQFLAYWGNYFTHITPDRPDFIFINQ